MPGVESKTEIDRFLNDTDPDLVGFCLDTAHTTYGGYDPIEVCRKWGDRIRYLHLKECDTAVLETVRANEWDYFKAVEIGVFPELGKGSVDFAGLLAVLQEIDYVGWAVVEQDIIPGSGVNALTSARANRVYLQAIGLNATE